jgi:hypothetical protein
VPFKSATVLFIKKLHIDQYFYAPPAPSIERKIMPNLNISHTVPVVRQTKTMSCWAAAAAMMLSWKTGIPRNELDAATQAGPNFVLAFNDNRGLPGTEIAELARALYLSTEPPASWTAQGYAKLLTDHGPLWVGTAIFSSTSTYKHVRIVTGISGDGSANGSNLSVIDPDGGRVYTIKVYDFAAELEAIARDDLGAGAELNPQIIRFP